MNQIKNYITLSIFLILATSCTSLKSPVNISLKKTVFGIPIYGVEATSDEKANHAATIMAEYLDNNEDGIVDNQAVLDALIKNKAFLIMWQNESDLSLSTLNQIKKLGGNIKSGQDLGNNETRPNWYSNGKKGEFDATYEEVLHLITHVGYANAYPSVFKETKGTYIANATDRARGGYFKEIPKEYPSTAWFTYDDKTADYGTMITEYLYWSLTTVLGAQENRIPFRINKEWKTPTKAQLEAKDKDFVNFLTNQTDDGKYKLPSKLPDGEYAPKGVIKTF